MVSGASTTMRLAAPSGRISTTIPRPSTIPVNISSATPAHDKRGFSARHPQGDQHVRNPERQSKRQHKAGKKLDTSPSSEYVKSRAVWVVMPFGRGIVRTRLRAILWWFVLPTQFHPARLFRVAAGAVPFRRSGAPARKLLKPNRVALHSTTEPGGSRNSFRGVRVSGVRGNCS